MHWAFELLDLPADADERAIKRAYALRLKTTRPDEDPVGFQRLNEAYRSALAAVQNGTSLLDDDSPDVDDDFDGDFDGGSGPGPFEEVSGEDHSPPSFDMDGEIEAILEALFECGRHDFPVYLRARSTNWSHDEKLAVGDALMQTLLHREPPVASHNFETIIAFFGYDDLHTGHDPLRLKLLMHRLKRVWNHAYGRRWSHDGRRIIRPGEPPPWSEEACRGWREHLSAVDFGDEDAEEEEEGEAVIDAPDFDFDFEGFFDALEIQIHGTYPPDFASWLERHPALRDAGIKRGIALRLRRFLEQRPTLPAGHVEALTTCFDLGNEDTAVADAAPSGFDLDRFFVSLEIQIHRTRPIDFRNWIEQHPALYYVSLKTAIAPHLVDFLERRPTLPREHVEALLSFFGLDRVGDDAPFLRQRVQRIMHRIAVPEPAKTSDRGEDGTFPIFWLIFLVFAIARCAGGFSG